MVRDPSLADALGLSPEGGSWDWPSLPSEVWGLLVLAARADPSVLDELPTEVRDRSASKVRSIARAAAKHSTAPAATAPAPTAAAPDLPKTVGSVRTWLAAHPDLDPSVLAAYPKQRAGERRAALRALGMLGSPAALEVLSTYAREGYSDADLLELHTMWGAFDRRDFAARMFRPSAWTLDLGSCQSIEGIGAVADLTSLDLIFTGAAELAPLAELTSLQRLSILSTVEPSITSVEPLTRLPELRSLRLSGVTRHADLSVLAGAPIRDAQISLDGADGSFLTGLRSLRTLILSGGSSAEDSGSPRESWEPEPIPAHPDLPQVVLALVRSGVDVVAYKHERAWVTQLVAGAESADDVFVDEVVGYVSVTADNASRDRLRTRMRLGTIVP